MAAALAGVARLGVGGALIAGNRIFSAAHPVTDVLHGCWRDSGRSGDLAQRCLRAACDLLLRFAPAVGHLERPDPAVSGYSASGQARDLANPPV